METRLYGVTVIRRDVLKVSDILCGVRRVGGEGDKKWEGGIRKESITRNI